MTTTTAADRLTGLAASDGPVGTAELDEGLASAWMVEFREDQAPD